MKAPVSERALIARINRALKREDDLAQLKTCREDSRAYSTCGRYYIVDHSRNTITATHVDLENLGRELGVLADHEEVEPD